MITSYSNPLIKRIKRLRQKKYREREQSHFIEGIRLVLSALETGAAVETLVYSAELLRSEIALNVLSEQREAGVECIQISASLFRSISERDNPVGLGAIVHNRWSVVHDFSVQPDDVFIALIDVAEPGNIGTIFRTADAVGATGLVLVGTTVDPYHPTALKASMGTIYSVPFARLDDVQQLFDWSVDKGIVTTATTAKKGIPYRMANYSKPAVLIMGSEREGLTKEIIDMAYQTVTIPMKGRSTSLNLAVATALILFELQD